jgi:ribosomal protein L30E
MSSMKYLVLIMSLWMSIAGYAQVGNAPSIKFPIEKVNFGAINADDGNVSHAFKFVNRGKKPLKIVNVLTTCGCTTPEWTQTEVKQGDSGQVVAVFDPRNKDGRFSKSLTVITNGDPHSVTLVVEGSVYSSNKDMLAMFPAKIGSLLFSTNQLELPAQKEDKIDTVWLGVYNPTNEIMFIHTVASPYMMRTEAKHVVLKEQSGDNIMFTYNGAMGKGLGPRVDTIYLLTSDPKIGTKTITIKANIVQNFDKLTAEELANAPVATFKQTEADLGQLYQGEVGTFAYEITNTGKSDLVIRRVRSECKCITAEVPQTVIKKGGKGKILVSFNTSRMHREVAETFTVITNDPKHSVTNMKIKAKVVIPGKEPVEY